MAEALPVVSSLVDFLERDGEALAASTLNVAGERARLLANLRAFAELRDELVNIAGNDARWSLRNNGEAIGPTRARIIDMVTTLRRLIDAQKTICQQLEHVSRIEERNMQHLMFRLVTDVTQQRFDLAPVLESYRTPSANVSNAALGPVATLGGDGTAVPRMGENVLQASTFESVDYFSEVPMPPPPPPPRAAPNDDTV